MDDKTLNSDAEPPVDDNVARMIAKAKREVEQMVDMVPQGIILLDGDGRIVRLNRAVLDLTGVERFDALLGTSFLSVFAGNDEAFADRVLKSKRGSQSAERHVSLPNGYVRELCFTVAGVASGLHVIMVSDVTGEKERVAEEVRAHKKEAVAALIGGLMHNLNQPLTVLTVTAKLMELGLDKSTPDLDEIRHNLTTVQDLVMQVKQMLEKVEAASDYVTEEYLAGKQILDFSKL